MVREIKFRAWWQPKKIEYHRGKVINPPHMLQVGDNAGTKTGLDCCVYANQGQSVILMQYTGLKDKNGKEIYEGDIVRLFAFIRNPKGGHFENTLTTSVKWNETGLNYNIWKSNDGEYWEVIGNIYENPELLKGGEFIGQVT